LWSLAKKRKEAFNLTNTGATVPWTYFLLARKQHVFFCSLPAVHGTCFQFSTGKSLAGFDDKSTRSWSFSTGGVLKISMVELVPGTPNNQFQMDVFLDETANHFPL